MDGRWIPLDDPVRVELHLALRTGDVEAIRRLPADARTDCG
jgi:hypothetical protein